MKKLISMFLCFMMTFSFFGGASNVLADNVVASIDNNNYKTMQEAIDQAQDGDEIVQLADIKGSKLEFTEGNKNITWNMNGHTYESTDELDVLKILGSDLTLTIKNGTLKSEQEKSYGVYAYTGANNLRLLLDNITFSTPDQTVGVQGQNSNQNVTIRNSDITSVQTTAIYFPPKSGTLTIDNSTVTAVNQSIVIKGGNVIIRGDNTRLETTGEAQEYDGPYQGSKNFPKTGNAIYVEDGYEDREIKLTVEGGTIISEKNKAVLFKSFEEKPSHTREVSITGGTFSSYVSQYLAEGIQLTPTKEGYVANPIATGIILNKISANIQVGNILVLNATTTPTGSLDTVTWSSSNSKVATVDANGKVTAVAPGKATITAQAGNGTATCEVIVYKVESDVEAPVINTSKPVDEVAVGINDQESQENIYNTLTSIVDNIANGNEVTSVNDETVKKIKEALNGNKVISTEVQVTPVKETEVNAQDKKVLEGHIDENVNIAQYLDINILVKAADQVIGKVNELDKEVIFTVAIPEDLMKEGRTFYVIRVHDGKAEKLETVENEDGTLTFKTDKFSTYALAYEDAQESTTTPTTPNQPNNPEQPTQPGQSQDDIKGEAVVTPDNNQQVTNTQNTQETAKEPKTGDTSNIALYGAMALISLGLVGAIVLKKKVSEK